MPAELHVETSEAPHQSHLPCIYPHCMRGTRSHPVCNTRTARSNSWYRWEGVYCRRLKNTAECFCCILDRLFSFHVAQVVQMLTLKGVFPYGREAPPPALWTRRWALGRYGVRVPCVYWDRHPFGWTNGRRLWRLTLWQWPFFCLRAGTGPFPVWSRGGNARHYVELIMTNMGTARPGPNSVPPMQPPSLASPETPTRPQWGIDPDAAGTALAALGLGCWRQTRPWVETIGWCESLHAATAAMYGSIWT